MTDYGPGHGNAWHQPEPWHDDPLFGDGGWDGGQQQQQQQQPGWQADAQQQYDPNGYATGGHPQQQQQQGYAGQGYQDPAYQQGYQDTSGQWHTGQPQQQWDGQTHGWQIQNPQPQQGWDTGQFAAGYDQGYGTDAYAHGGWGADPYAQQDQAAADPYAGPAAHGQTWGTGQYPAADGGTGQFAVPDGTGQYHMPVDGAGQYHVPDGGSGQFAVPADGGTGQFAVPQTGTGQFAVPDAATAVREQAAHIPAQAAPAEPRTAPPAGPAVPPQAAAPGAPPRRRVLPDDDEEDRWDPFGDEGEETHPFFTGDPIGTTPGRRPRTLSDDERDDDEDDAPPGGRAPAKGKKEKKAKRRNGCACLAVAVVLVGGVGGGGYAGWTYYQSHIAPPPDWPGNGTGSVQVTVPDAATLATIGNILKKEGVVESVDAFTRAAGDNPKAAGIQGGTYTLHGHMSAAAAVAMMLDPTSQNTLIVTEGMRDAAVYTLIDSHLHLKPGTTKAVAHSQAKKLGLPSWADDDPHIKDPLEGFLFPTRYGFAKGEKPEVLLRQMVTQAKQQYDRLDVTAQAKAHGLRGPLEFITVASLVQAEGKTDADFRKMAKVVYNRIDPSNPETYGKLQFDSTYNYIKNASHTSISSKELATLDDPYNTYRNKGLPPGPIDNPGLQALQAVEHPDSGAWYYFISLDGRTTRFTKTYAEFQVLYHQYNAQHGNS